MRTHSLTPRLLFLCLSLTAAMVLAAVVSARAEAAPIKLGVYSASQGQVGAPEDEAALDRHAAAVGREPDIVMDYSNVTDPLLSPVEVSNLASRGQTPLVTWQLYQSGWSGPTIPLAEIAAGKYDSDLRDAAEEAKAMPFPELLIRFGHEMNGNWYGWSGNPSAYVEAWRHAVSVFREAGASNVKWVWSPNVDNGSYPFAAYFPGDAWVDYVGLDGYNWGTSGVGVDKWQSLAEVFASSYAQLTQLSARPVIIAEISSSEIGGDKAAWITAGFLHTIPEDFPRVEAVIWFDRSQEDDWRIASSQASLDAYRRVVSNSLYGGTDPAPTREAAEAVPPPPVVEEVRVTTPVAGVAAPKGKKSRGTIKRRARVLYRVSRRAAVRVAVRARGNRGRGARATLTIARPKLRGSIRLSRLLGGRRLGRGGYEVLVTAIDPQSGAASRPRNAHFRLRRAARP